MFRKKRSSSQPPTQPQPGAPSTPSATSAAALAFLSKRGSDANLSSAAAAAALRSYQATPEPVGSIQTKRMIRRESTSSIGSGTGSIRQPFSSGLQRTGSTASLSNRTFRSPSPGGRNVQPAANLPSDVPPIPTKSHRRNPSTESSQRVASPRFSSPVPHHTSMATNGVPPATTVRYDPNTRTLIRVPVQPSSQQSGPPSSPRSINFSRPMSPPVTYNARVREPTKARPASAQGFLASETLRAAPRSSANPTVQPTSGDEVVPALVAASAAARTTPAIPAPLVNKTRVSPGKPTSAGLTTSNNTTPQRSLSTSEAMTSNGPKPNVSPIQVKNPVQSAPVPPPSQEQIKAFQTRAASMLARPRSDAAAAAAVTTTTIQDKTLGEEQVPSPSSQQQAPTSSNAVSEQRSAPSPIPQLLTTVVEAAKPSHSPTRSAHFSESPLLDNVKHQPPPRALSPAKSALKAPSPRASSPAGSTGRAMSDTSETRSEDGNISTQKKKKVVRVSFDEQPELVGEAATPQTPINTLASPQYRKGSADSWTSNEDHEYTPRPTLPSFGSIRGHKSPSTPEREQSPQAPIREPKPPSVGVASPATSELSGELNRGTVVEQPVLSESSTVSSQEHGEVIPSDTVPAISILPATPRPDQETKEFISDSDATPPKVAGSDTMEQDNSSPSSTGFVPLTEASENRREQADTESDENAEIFADAAEGHSDADANESANALHGFLEPSATELAPQTILEEPDEGSTADSKDEENVSGTAATGISLATTQAHDSVEESEDWERIRRYWNSLSEERRQELEREAATSNANAAQAESKNEESPSAKQAPLPPWPDREYQKTTAAKPMSFPQSLRAGHERTGSENAHLKTTLRDNARPVSAHIEPKSAPLSTQRPKSAVVTSTAASSASAAGLLSQTSGGKKEPIRPSLERNLSNDSSTSESSFRRQRRGSVASSEGGGFNLRRTMRAPKEPEPTSPPPTRTSLRAKGDAGGQGMKTRSFRTTEQRSTNRTSMFGMGKSSKSAGGLGKSSRGGFKSRFDDSSDEETEGRPHFVSRFDDSDESDDETNYKRATPASPSSPRTRKSKRQASVDSSDMSAGGNEVKSSRETTKQMSVLKGRSERPSTPPNPNGTVPGTALHAGTLRMSNEGTSTASSPVAQGSSKRSFFGLGKRHTHTASKSNVELPGAIKESSASPKVTTEAGTPSKAVPNTRPRSSFFRRLSTSATGSTTRLPTKEDFPYPPPPIPGSTTEQSSGAARPNTSDGTGIAAVTTPTRPPLGSKRDSAMTAPVEPVSPIMSVRTGKKKKFQGLRRLLRVQD